MVYDGAKEVLLSDKATSLLLIGIDSVEGYIKKGDLVSIYDTKGNQLGVGKAQYDSAKTQALLGSKKAKPFIHYDYLYLPE